jgi:hypothetical protein
MPVPCIQERDIALLKERDERIMDTLDDLKSANKRFLELLETIAEQGARITHVEGDVKRLENCTEQLFNRLRDVEQEPVKDLSLTKVGVISAVMGAFASFILSLLLKK